MRRPVKITVRSQFSYARTPTPAPISARRTTIVVRNFLPRAVIARLPVLLGQPSTPCLQLAPPPSLIDFSCCPSRRPQRALSQVDRREEFAIQSKTRY